MQSKYIRQIVNISISWLCVIYDIALYCKLWLIFWLSKCTQPDRRVFCSHSQKLHGLLQLQAQLETKKFIFVYVSFWSNAEAKTQSHHTRHTQNYSTPCTTTTTTAVGHTSTHAHYCTLLDWPIPDTILYATQWIFFHLQVILHNLFNATYEDEHETPFSLLELELQSSSFTSSHATALFRIQPLSSTVN